VVCCNRGDSWIRTVLNMVRQIVGDPTPWLLNPLGTVTSSLILRKLATTRDKMASPWLCERVTFHSE
jgi:hypothetical protein